MKTKSMIPFWVVGGISILVSFIGVISLCVALFDIIVTGAMPEELIEVILGGGLMIWSILIPIVQIVVFIMGIIHLVFYAGNKFTNNDSKVVHSLYQVFFGLGLIGLIVVLVLNPKQQS